MSGLLYYPTGEPESVGRGEPVATKDPHPHDGVERRADPPALLLEAWYYLSTFMGLYGFQFGFARITGLIGSTIYIGGVLAFALYLRSGRRIPATIWFLIAINFFGNLSQIANGHIPLVSHSKTLTFWLCKTAMVCYFVRSQAATRRAIAILTIFFLLQLASGGSMNEMDRLQVVGPDASFGNANKLGMTAGTYCILLLFWSLRASVVLRPMIWAMATACLLALLLSVSRSALLQFALGASLLGVAVMGGRGMRLGGVAILLVGVILAGSFSFVITDTMDRLQNRIENKQKEERLEVYSMGTVLDLADTLVIGWGADPVVIQRESHEKVNPHNAWLLIHMAYGGVTAWIFAAWFFTLGIRVARMARDRRVDFGLRMEMVAHIGMLFVCLFFTNRGYYYYGSILQIAIIEKYTSPYSSRQIARRRLAARKSASLAQPEHETDASPSFS